jgi:hypothetical protein
MAAADVKVTVVFAALAFAKVADPAVTVQFTKPQVEAGVADRENGVPGFANSEAGLEV